MLMAQTINGERISAFDAKKVDENGEKIKYFCTDCLHEVILKQGHKNIWHFSHKSKQKNCRHNGESLYHQMMKALIKEYIEYDNDLILSELEHSITDNKGRNYIADYYCEVLDVEGNIKKIAIECVFKHNDAYNFRRKTQFYSDNDIYVLWIFDLNKFFIPEGGLKEEVRINEIIEEARKMYIGRIYALDAYDGGFCEIFLNGIERWHDEWEDNLGYSYTLKRTKSPVYYAIDDIYLNNFYSFTAQIGMPYDRKILILRNGGDINGRI